MAITGETKRLRTLRLAKASGHLHVVQKMVADASQSRPVSLKQDRSFEAFAREVKENCYE